MKMGEAMYKDQQGQQPEGGPGDAGANPDSKDGEKKDDDVIDADFEEVDEDKSADSK
jgi:molecular chaperone DnaK